MSPPVARAAPHGFSRQEAARGRERDALVVERVGVARSAFLMAEVSSEMVVASEAWLPFRSVTVLCSVETAAAFCGGGLLLRVGRLPAPWLPPPARRPLPAAPASTAHPCLARLLFRLSIWPCIPGAERLESVLHRGAGGFGSLFTCVLLRRRRGVAGLGIRNNETGRQHYRGSRLQSRFHWASLLCWKSCLDHGKARRCCFAQCISPLARVHSRNR